LDGQENTPSNIYSQRLHEVQKFLCVTRHGYLGYAVLVNKQFWERLPQPIRAQLQSALNDATLYGNAIAAKENLVALEGIRHSGKVQIHEPVERELHSWMTALSGVEVQARQWIGPAVIDGIKRAAAPP
jgi:C4-dicarboxylate-binding protein DctP